MSVVLVRVVFVLDVAVAAGACAVVQLGKMLGVVVGSGETTIEEKPFWTCVGCVEPGMYVVVLSLLADCRDEKMGVREGAMKESE